MTDVVWKRKAPLPADIIVIAQVGGDELQLVEVVRADDVVGLAVEAGEGPGGCAWCGCTRERGGEGGMGEGRRGQQVAVSKEWCV